MKSRFYLGIGLLLLFLILGFAAGVILQNLHMPTAATLEAAAEAVLSGEREKGSALYLQAQEQWQRYWKGTAAVSAHIPIEEIEKEFSQLPVYLSADHSTDFAAGCMRLASLIRAVAEAQNLHWWNLL